MFKLKPAKGSAIDQINIQKVTDGVLVLSGSRYRKIIKTSSVNFELKSDNERDDILSNYRSFLNGLSFPIQITIRTRELDIENYIEEIDRMLKNESSQIYRSQLISYSKFVKKLVNSSSILSRSFYIVVPFESQKDDFHLAREQLEIRTEMVIKGFQRLGMSAICLSDLEILNLFYSYYSPEASKLQPLSNKVIKSLQPVLVGGNNDQLLK